MNLLRQQLRSISALKSLSSIKLTVACLTWLFVLVFWGTVAQVEQGLYLAQKRFFYSWFFTAFGFLPLPGGQFTLWVLFINLAAVSITRFVYQLRFIGILIVHIGLLLYFVAAFITFHVTEESNVTLMEGGATNVSSAYHDWEISFWEEAKASTKKVSALDLHSNSEGTTIPLAGLNTSLQILKFYSNADAYTSSPENTIAVLNDSGIKALGPQKYQPEPEKNVPGVIFSLISEQKDLTTLLLYGAESVPTRVIIQGKKYNFQLRRRHSPLPFLITLKDFTAEFHPGTQVARKYQSLVTIEHDGISREVLIYMNTPLRFREYTLYQASYSIDELGREYSTLAVVRNHGRWLPYVASMVTAFGLALHFILQGFAGAQRSRSQKK